MSSIGPIVFLHGFLGSPSEWAAVRLELNGAGITLAPVLPLAADWQSGIQQLAVELPQDCVLVGYSLGARIALGCAVSCPERIRAACLLSGHPGLEDPLERQARVIHDLRVARRLRNNPLDEFLDQWYRQPIFASIDPATRSRWISERLNVNRQYHSALLRTYSLAMQPNYWPDLSQLQMPCQLLVGQHDAKYVAIGQRVVSVAPHSQLQVIPAAGHAVHREQPQQVADRIHDVIAEAHISK